MRLRKVDIRKRKDLPLSQIFDFVVVDLDSSGMAIGYFFDEPVADLFINSVIRAKEDTEAIDAMRKATIFR